ncbi:MAG: PSD1 and planctomycete cytochrome C domain-containing protein [Acidobacteria bacterium]|nr:PSD1 and planctomycete cytochrome C domain-containing protein [Acidobacteriota bacterium]
MIRAAPFLLAWLAAVGTVAGASEIDPADLEFFESKIRPVLVERCYQCHGGDPAKIRGGLILLDAEGVRAGGDSGAVIVPGSPQDSLMIEALHYEGLTQMPPDGKLPAHVIADFEQWIRRGAPDPRTGAEQTVVATRTAETFDYGPGREHWAFRRVEDPALPEVEDEAWGSHDLDRFILSRLEERGLAPVAPADKRTLLRRATFDLIGLAPSEAEIEDFLADESPDAFAKVVDRLLASPHYGERWGRHWLDVARYADSNGLDENIAFPNAFRYRDYVVDSLNRDKPFNRFVREQIAGDLMSADTDAQRFEQITATGFLMLGPKVLAEQDTDKMLIDIVDEQVNTLGRAFLALPVGCARCHDHKFDPIPTADYYAMAGILRSTETMSDAAGMRWLERPLAPEDEIAEYEAAQKLVAEAQEKVDEVVREQNDVLRGPRRAALADYLLAAEEAYPSWSDDEEKQEAARETIGRVAGSRGLEPPVLERWVRAFHRYREGPPVEGDAPSPSTVFVIWNAYAAASPDRFEQVTEDLRAIIASEKVLTAPLTRSLVRGPAPKTLEEVAWRYASLFATIEIAWEEHLMRLGLKDEDELRPSDFRLPREQEELRWLVYDGYFCILCLDQEEEEKLYPQEALEQLARLRAEVERREEASPPTLPYAMAVDETATVDLPVHIRGSHLNLAEEPERRGYLKVTDHLVPPPPVADDTSGRLELARWITHPEHPLTARVIVNRVWHWHFGRGIVDTPSNFGAIGSTPSHPDLLDWLARRFVEGGWSLKNLHRDIMLSSTYRLSTDYDAANAAVDEENRLLWRMNRRRLEVEPIRDALLQLAGRLDLTIGGRVEEYKARGYVFGEYGPLDRVDLYDAPRRSIYMPVVRTAVYPIFGGFDFGDASDSVGDRSETVVPRQALLMMNSPFVEEAALGFAQQLLEIEDADAADRIDTAFVRAYGRPADATEIADSLAFLDEMRSCASDTGCARGSGRTLGAPASSPASASADAELYAWTRLSHVILAASEFIYIN